MRSILTAFALSAALATGALAQGATDTSPNATGSTAPRGAAVTMEQQTRIRTYIQTVRPAPQTLPTNTTVATGDGIPASLELRTFPNDVGLTDYRYVVVGETVYLVDPATRRVVHIIQ
jgi:hypothetical protein